MEHPADDLFFRFLLGATCRQENRQIVRHLLARCPRCTAVLRSMKPEPPVDPGAYDEALERFTARLRELTSADGAGRLGASPSSGGATPKRASG